MRLRRIIAFKYPYREYSTLYTREIGNGSGTNYARGLEMKTIIGTLNIEMLGRGFALDTGTHDNLLDAARFAEMIEKWQGYRMACLEEIARCNGWLADEQVKGLAQPVAKNGYGGYFLELLKAETGRTTG